MFSNPTNMDIDYQGRVWVAEGVNYRKFKNKETEKREAGDRIVVLSDTNGDGTADSSHVFVQEEMLVAPLGIAVIDNKIIVSQPPDLIVYTDVDRNARFDPEIDKREVLLTGFNGLDHDHSLHSVTASLSTPLRIKSEQLNFLSAKSEQLIFISITLAAGRLS